MTNLEKCGNKMQIAEKAWLNSKTTRHFLDWIKDEWTQWEPREKTLQHTVIFDLVEKQDPGEIGFNPVGINAPDWASIVVEKDGKYATVTQLRYGLMKMSVEFPCGQVEKDEDPKHAVIRELEEETGLQVGIDDVKSLGTFAANPAFMSNFMHYFYVNLDNVKFEHGATHFDEHEKLEFAWIDKEEIWKNGFDGCSVFMGGAMLKLKLNGLA